MNVIPRTADHLDDPGKFLMGSEAHVHYWHMVLNIDAWFAVNTLGDINHVHMKMLSIELMRAEAEGRPVHRQAIQSKESIKNPTAGDCEYMRARLDTEMQHLDLSWKVGAMFLFQMDLGYTKLSMAGHGKSRWGDIREFLIFEFRLFGLEDLSGLDQESLEKEARAQALTEGTQEP